MDADSSARYRALPGELGDHLRRVLRTEANGDTYLTIENGRCPMWRADGLCRIQASLGHDALCETCRDFPRLNHDYGDFVELGLELSCPEAARILLTAADSPWLEQELPGGSAPEYDLEIMDILLQSRREAITLLTDPRFSTAEAIAVLLMYGYHVQSAVDGAPLTVFDPDAALVEAHSFAKVSDPTVLPAFFAELEILTGPWRSRLAAGISPSPWLPILRRLARYFVERYWLQAVSDYDLVCRVKLAVVSCILIRQLGGNLIQTAQLYSKEIENNTENVEAILDAAYTHPAMTDERLLGWILM